MTNPLETLLTIGVVNGEITQDQKDKILKDLSDYEKSLENLETLEREIKKYGTC